MRIYVILLCSLYFSTVNAQWNNSSLQLKDKLKYQEAIKKYESSHNQVVADFEYARTLFKIGQYQKAFNVYIQLHQNKDSFSAFDIQNFLTSIKIENASIYDSFLNIYKSKQAYIQNIQSKLNMVNDSFVFENYAFNSSEYEDFGPTKFDNKLIFVSSRVNPIGRLDNYSYNSQPFYDVYIEDKNDVININDYKSRNLPKEINTDLHDGPIFISEKSNLVFITRNLTNSKLKALHLGIFYSQKINNKWTKFLPIPDNGENYSVQHPFFDDSTQELYFSSNKIGNNFNLFKMKFDNGKWKNSEILNNKINSNLDEVFPYVYNSTLYFSSNGFSGKGGFDLICYDPKDSIYLLNNINSPFDDYGILYLNDTSGYISTNRLGGFGKDDILKFRQIKIQKSKTVIEEPIIAQKENSNPTDLKIAENKKSPKNKKTAANTKQNNPVTPVDIENPIVANTKKPTKIKIKPVINQESLITPQNECGDLDHDGILDYKDSDSDNDGILDKMEGQSDVDNDRLPNYLDLDSDNDLIPDEIEGTDDFDHDKVPNFIDKDSDNDGISDKIEENADFDGDESPNYLDLDSDNDGIKDKVEGNRDSDDDGILNVFDDDSDNDGISDKTEGSLDFDKDGLPNFIDVDSDGDGIPDEIENGSKSNPKFADADGDGKPNYLDLDSDMDGIPDSMERPKCVK